MPAYRITAGRASLSGPSHKCRMANGHVLAAARSLCGKQKVGDSTYGPESSPLPSSTVGKLLPAEEDDSEEYRPSDSFPAPADLPLEPEMDATDVPITKKRKSEETSDQSDADTEPTHPGVWALIPPKDI
jgi:hypothetical protein